MESTILDYKGDRGLRLLDIFERLNRGELLNKRELEDLSGTVLEMADQTVALVFGSSGLPHKSITRCDIDINERGAAEKK